MAKVDDTSALWQEYRRTQDRTVRDRLILTYAPLVKFVAGRLGSGLPAHVDEGDLVSYGLLGLIGAIERYDPDREIKFETYAIARIKGAIIDELRALDWVPRSVRARARDIERAIAELEKKLHRAPTDEEIAEKLGMTEEELGSSLTEISRSSIAALDELWTVSAGGDQIALIDTIEDTQGPEPQSALAQTEMKEALGEAIARLPGAREARRHALLLRGADAARDRRGARRHRVPRLPAAHEGDPPAEGPPRRRPRAARLDPRPAALRFGSRPLEIRGGRRACPHSSPARSATSPSSAIEARARPRSSRRCSSRRARRTASARSTRARRSPTGTTTSSSGRCRSRSRSRTRSGRTAS